MRVSVPIQVMFPWSFIAASPLMILRYMNSKFWLHREKLGNNSGNAVVAASTYLFLIRFELWSAYTHT